MDKKERAGVPTAAATPQTKETYRAKPNGKQAYDTGGYYCVNCREGLSGHYCAEDVEQERDKMRSDIDSLFDPDNEETQKWFVGQISWWLRAPDYNNKTHKLEGKAYSIEDLKNPESDFYQEILNDFSSRLADYFEDGTKPANNWKAKAKPTERIL